MNWIKSEDRLPKHGVSVLVEYRIGKYVKLEFNGSVPTDWWIKNIKRWLDESELSFTLDDIKNTWIACCKLWEERSDRSIPNKLFSDYMYDEYKIDINK